MKCKPLSLEVRTGNKHQNSFYLLFHIPPNDTVHIIAYFFFFKAVHALNNRQSQIIQRIIVLVLLLLAEAPLLFLKLVDLLVLLGSRQLEHREY